MKPKRQHSKNMKSPRRIYKLTGLIACTLAAAFAGSASAATLSNIGSTWPGSPALETVTNAEDNNARGLTEARGEFVQSFTTTTSFQIDKIYIESSGTTANREFQLRIFEMADVTTNTAGTVVLAPITISTGAISSAGVFEIDLVGAEQITLAAAQGYGIAITAVDDGDPENNASSVFGWTWHDHRGAVAEIYTDGEAFGNGAGPDFDRTLAFTAVPEPSAALLGALGLLALLRRRR